MTKHLIAIALLSAGLARADLARAKSEPNLERRSHLALENAEEAIRKTKDTYGNGDTQGAEKLLQEVRESVELAESSLKATGKNPSRSPKHFKYAEIKTRDLIKRLDALQREMNVGDRGLVDPIKGKVQQVHDDILLGVMGKK